MIIYGIGGAAFLLRILALLRIPAACLAIVRQECRTSYYFGTPSWQIATR